ncbi:hypothetical protein GCM10011316_12940 [Roseibium aquae]|uniref:Uncharacterized protein n=1 Tax=Roseibium aquae TaxID=1323746 RepID=A0A916TFU9_9HYPH|nr:hypothetical protein GCM10011316_12940 [Roseibium aquae]
MGPRDGIDAVDLNKTELIDHRHEILPLAGTGKRGGQAMAVEKKMAGPGVGDLGQGG